MKAIKIAAANEALFIRAAQIIGVSIIKLPKILLPGFVFYRVVAPFSQMDLFYLGIFYERLLVKNNVEK